MAKKKNAKTEACAPGCGPCCCRVESVVPVDERGQMVLPKDLREKAGIRAGDKLALVSWEKDGRVCCLFLMKEQELAATVKGILGPMLNDMNLS